MLTFEFQIFFSICEVVSFCNRLITRTSWHAIHPNQAASRTWPVSCSLPTSKLCISRASSEFCSEFARLSPQTPVRYLCVNHQDAAFSRPVLVYIRDQWGHEVNGLIQQVKCHNQYSSLRFQAFTSLVKGYEWPGVATPSPGSYFLIC